MKKIRAFTLVELVITIVIIGILSAISIFSYREFINQSKDTVKIRDIGNINEAINYTLASGGDLVEPDNIKNLSVTLEETGDLEWIEGEFGENNFAKHKSIGILPKDPITKENYKLYVSKDFYYYRIETKDLEGKTLVKTNYRPVAEENNLAMNNGNNNSNESGAGTQQNTGNQSGSSNQNSGTQTGENNSSGGINNQSQTITSPALNSDGSQSFTLVTNNGSVPYYLASNGKKWSNSSSEIMSKSDAEYYCQNLGNGWKIPSREEFQEIKTNSQVSGNTFTHLQTIINKKGEYWNSYTYETDSHQDCHYWHMQCNSEISACDVWCESTKVNCEQRKIDECKNDCTYRYGFPGDTGYDFHEVERCKNNCSYSYSYSYHECDVEESNCRLDCNENNTTFQNCQRKNNCTRGQYGVSLSGFQNGFNSYDRHTENSPYGYAICIK